MTSFPPGRWRARWIWAGVPALRPATMVSSEPDPEAGGTHCLFRRTFDLDVVPVSVPCRVTADSRYVLWVNGVEVSRGPVRGDLRRLRCDVVDLAPALRAGENVLAVHARFYGAPTPWWAPVPGALQLGGGAFVLEAIVSGSTVGSDRSWKALRSDAWTAVRARGIGGSAPESFDARRLPAGWRDVRFDDAPWEVATELVANSIGFAGHHEPPSHPYGALQARPLPRLTAVPRTAMVVSSRSVAGGRDVDDPVDQVAADLGSSGGTDAARSLAGSLGGGDVQVVTVDFGEVVAGTLMLELDALEGTRVDLAGAETVDADGLPDREQHTGLRYVARGGDDRYESLDPVGLRFATLSVRSPVPGPVAVPLVSVRERLRPSPTGPSFACSDPRLDHIWAVGRRTVDLCAQDAYLDCPTREQRAWVGDFVVHQMVDLATNVDWSLARWNVEMAASPRPDGMLPMAVAGDLEAAGGTYIPDWALHWVRALYNLHRSTGDEELVARLLPVAEGVLSWFAPFLGPDGLLHDVTGWVILDWSSVRGDGASATLNGLYARALLDVGMMARWLGDDGRAGRAMAGALALGSAMEAFWDSEREVYVDTLLGGRRLRAVSQHGQAAAIVAGAVPPDRLGRLVSVLTDRSHHVHATWSRASGDSREPGPGESGVAGPYLLTGYPEPWWDVESQVVVAQPFFRYVVHDALVAAGRADLIPDQCLDWEALLERSATTWSETWYGGTHCHGWSSTPTRDLTTRTLGVTPGEPGFTTARVAPRLGPLEWARGAVPTPFGLLSVDVRRTPRGVEVDVDSPVPVDLDLDGGKVRRLPAGNSSVTP